MTPADAEGQGEGDEPEPKRVNGGRNYTGPKVNRCLSKIHYMLEHRYLEYLLANEGDNLWSADNQQERLVRIGWTLGFVDGEGCFSIGFVRQPGRTDR